jgi:hypothetical protein
VNALRNAVERANAIVKTGADSDRRLRKLADAAAKCAQQANAWTQEAAKAQERVNQESAAAVRSADDSERSLTAPALAAPAPLSAPSAAKSADESDVFELIRKLGELRDAGLVSPEEFETKKAELLARL